MAWSKSNKGLISLWILIFNFNFNSSNQNTTGTVWDCHVTSLTHELTAVGVCFVLAKLIGHEPEGQRVPTVYAARSLHLFCLIRLLVIVGYNFLFQLCHHVLSYKLKIMNLWIKPLQLSGLGMNPTRVQLAGHLTSILNDVLIYYVSNKTVLVPDGMQSRPITCTGSYVCKHRRCNSFGGPKKSSTCQMPVFSPVFSANSWSSSTQAIGDRHRPADQQPNAQPALPPAAGPPPPRPRHVRLLPPVRHLRLHTCLAGCLTSAADQVARGGGAPGSH